MRELATAGGPAASLLWPLLRTEAIASSRIEGLAVSHHRLALEGVDPGRDTLAGSVLGNLDALRRALDLAGGPLTVDAVRTIHRALLEGTADHAIAGELRREQNWIGGRHPNPRGAAFVPPPEDRVEDLLEDLCRFCERDDLPPLVQAAVAHVQFETIHPFADGNGRVGRALIHVVLGRRGLSRGRDGRLTLPPVSLVLAGRSNAYIAGLSGFRAGRVEEWLGFFLDVAYRSAVVAETLFSDLAALQERWLAQAGEPREGSAARTLIRRLPESPVIDLAGAAELTGASREATRRAIDRLEAAGVLRELTGRGRLRRWESVGLFAILDGLEGRFHRGVRGARTAGPAWDFTSGGAQIQPSTCSSRTPEGSLTARSIPRRPTRASKRSSPSGHPHRSRRRPLHRQRETIEASAAAARVHLCGTIAPVGLAALAPAAAEAERGVVLGRVGLRDRDPMAREEVVEVTVEGPERGAVAHERRHQLAPAGDGCPCRPGWRRGSRTGGRRPDASAWRARTRARGRRAGCRGRRPGAAVASRRGGRDRTGRETEISSGRAGDLVEGLPARASESEQGVAERGDAGPLGIRARQADREVEADQERPGFIVAQAEALERSALLGPRRDRARSPSRRRGARAGDPALARVSAPVGMEDDHRVVDPGSPPCRSDRVTPFGDLVAVSDRGMFMGNRGVLHDDGRRIVRFSQGRRWIICLTAFKDRRRTLMVPGNYTELFFMDEATALAAGHRPCHECRRADALRFREAWAEGAGRDPAIGLEALDRELDEERLVSRGVMRRWASDGAALPDGAMVAIDGAALLVHSGALRPWNPAGYGEPRPMPASVEVLTPRSVGARSAPDTRR